MKPKDWLDLIDVLRRVLAVLRRILGDLWGDGGQAEPVGDG